MGHFFYAFFFDECKIIAIFVAINKPSKDAIMLTRKQEQLELNAAFKIKDDIVQGRWNGIDKNCLYIIDCDPGVSIEVNLDKYIHGLSLTGLPDFSEDGKYLIQLVMENGIALPKKSFVQKAAYLLEPSDYPNIICDGLFENNKIYNMITNVLDNLMNNPK